MATIQTYLREHAALFPDHLPVFSPGATGLEELIKRCKRILDAALTPISYASMAKRDTAYPIIRVFMIDLAKLVVDFYPPNIKPYYNLYKIKENLIKPDAPGFVPGALEAYLNSFTDEVANILSDAPIEMASVVFPNMQRPATTLAAHAVPSYPGLPPTHSHIPYPSALAPPAMPYHPGAYYPPAYSTIQPQLAAQVPIGHHPIQASIPHPGQAAITQPAPAALIPQPAQPVQPRAAVQPAVAAPTAMGVQAQHLAQPAAASRSVHPTIISWLKSRTHGPTFTQQACIKQARHLLVQGDPCANTACPHFHYGDKAAMTNMLPEHLRHLL